MPPYQSPAEAGLCVFWARSVCYWLWIQPVACDCKNETGRAVPSLAMTTRHGPVAGHLLDEVKLCPLAGFDSRSTLLGPEKQKPLKFSKKIRGLCLLDLVEPGGFEPASIRSYASQSLVLLGFRRFVCFDSFQCAAVTVTLLGH